MNSSDSSNSRRSFLKKAAVALAVVPSLSQILNAEAQDPASLKPLDPAGNPVAVSQGYVADATKVDTVKFPKRKGPEGEKQFCSNCQLLIKTGITVPGTPGEWGQCALFMGSLVNTQGWCNSWTPKA